MALAAGCGRHGTKRLLCGPQPLKGHPGHQLTQIAFAEGCRKLGYECAVVGTDSDDVAGTIALAEQAPATGGPLAGMAVWTGNPALNPLIARAAAAKVPVVLPHFPAPEGSTPGASGVISCDPAEYAAAAADLIGRAIGGQGSVAITQGSPNTTENLVSKTFARVMAEKYPGVKVLKPQTEGFNAPAAIALAGSIMQANPDLVAALSTTGGGASTWAGAQRDNGRKIVIVGMDYTRANLDLVKKGEVYAVIAQPMWEESYGAAELLDKLARGEKIKWWTKLPAPAITKDNVDQYYAIPDKVEAALRNK